MRTRFLLLATMLLAVLGVRAQAAEADDNPAIVVNSDAVELQFYLAATEDTQVEVDFGAGNGREVFQIGTSVTDPTVIRGTVGESRVVNIYGDGESLTYFSSEGYYITSFDASNCPGLAFVDLPHNVLKELDFSNNSVLQYLNCEDNLLTALSLGQNPDLQYLQVNNNADLGNIDLSQFPKLQIFIAYNNKNLTQIDTSNNPLLQQLSVDGTGISTISVAANPELLILNIDGTKVTQLDVSSNSKLQELYVSKDNTSGLNYPLRQIDVSNNPELIRFFCQGNQLETLDVSKNTKLQTIHASNNNLTSIDLSNNTSLTELWIDRNKFNFNTLPRMNLATYIYAPQHTLSLEQEYVVGSTIDLTEQVLDESSNISFAIYMVPKSNSDNAVDLIPYTDYTFNDAQITFIKAQTDSIEIKAYNESFPDLALQTTRFKVKSEEDFGKPSKKVEFTTSNTGQTIGFTVAVNSSEGEVYVDFGDGEQKAYTVTSSGTSIRETAVGSTIAVYTPTGIDITKFTAQGIGMETLDITQAEGLTDLDVSSNALTELDLRYNRLLRSISVYNNQLESLDFTGINSSYRKNLLTSIMALQNKLTSINLDGCGALTTLNVNNNQLSTIDFTSVAERLQTLQCYDNLIEEIDLSSCVALQQLDLRNNSLSSLDLTNNTALEYIMISNNNLKFSTLPQSSIDYYMYAPQKNIQIKEMGYSVDLSSECMIDGVQTVYTWYDETGNKLTVDEDYTIENGVTTFINTEIGKVYCAMTNTKFPSFTGGNSLKTTSIQPMPKPTDVIATINATSEAGTAVEFRLGAKESNTYVYIDYGDGNLQECALQETYSVFNGTLAGNGEIKVYSYDKADNGVTIFTVIGITASNVDVTALTDLYALNIGGLGLSSIDLSQNPNLKELYINDNNFATFDFGQFPQLQSLVCYNNNLSEINFSGNAELERILCSNNNLTTIDVSSLTKLKNLYCGSNQLTSLDVTNNLELHTLDAYNNHLAEINLENNPNLRVITLSNNDFTFTSLPLPRQQWTVYSYSPQSALQATVNDGIVDLSAQKEVSGYETVYSWATVSGTTLTEGTDYRVEDGVTYFLKAQEEDVVCTMSNEALPNLQLTTVNLSVKSAGVSAALAETMNVYAANGNIVVEAESESLATVYTLSGTVAAQRQTSEATTLIGGLQSGAYIVKVVGADGAVVTRKVVL